MRLTVLFLAVASVPFAAGAQPVPPSAPVPACLSVAELEALLPENRLLAAAFCGRGDVRAQERVRAVLRLLRRDGAASAETPP